MSVTTIARTAAIATLIGIATAAGAGIASAQAPAHATVQDNKFLDTLDSQGITYDSSYNAIKAAGYVCGSFDNGASFNDVAYNVLQQSSLTEYNAGYFIGASVLVYCPEYSSELPS